MGILDKKTNLDQATSYSSLRILGNKDKVSLANGGYDKTISLRDIKLMDLPSDTKLNCLLTTEASQGEAVIMNGKAYVFNSVA